MSHGIRVVNFLFSVVRNCRVYECDGTGLYMTATSVYTDESHFTGNYVDFCNGYGIVISGTGDHIVKANQVKFCNLGNIWLTNCYNVTVEGNQVLSAGLDASFNVIGAGRGILIQNSPRCQVIGNQVRANTQEGINIYSSSSCVVANNYCQYNSMASAGGYPGILVYNSAGVTITANHSGDYAYASQSAPLNVRHQSYGISVTSYSDVTLCGNDFDSANNLSGGAHVSASAYIARGNLGLADYPTASGSTTGPLTAADWSAFNAKVSFPGFSGSGSSGYAAQSDHNHSGVYEPALGNPIDGVRVLASSSAGMRSWVAYPVSFPGFGTNHSTAAYGDHAHEGVYAHSVHYHAASDVTSGVFDIARIPTGSTSTTVSLGDHNHSRRLRPGQPRSFWGRHHVGNDRDQLPPHGRHRDHGRAREPRPLWGLRAGPW